MKQCLICKNFIMCMDTILVYKTIYNSISKAANRVVIETEPNDSSNDNSMNFKNNILFKGLVVGEIGRKNFLLFLKPENQCNVLNYWEREIDHLDITNNMIWMRSFICTKESYLRCLQWKIIHLIYP